MLNKSPQPLTELRVYYKNKKSPRDAIQNQTNLQNQTRQFSLLIFADRCKTTTVISILTWPLKRVNN